MSLEKIINDAWENKNQVNPNSDQSLKDAINQVINDNYDMINPSSFFY